MKPWMHRISICLTIALLSVMFSVMGAAQQAAQTTPIVPRLVSYSGHAFDAQKKPITGGIGVTFAIYREEEGGAPLWLETQSVQADAGGNYTVELGATKTEGLPLHLFSSRESRWLGVTISGPEEQHRALLLSVPYALKAADSETLGGLPASAFMLAAPASGPNISATSDTASPSSTPPALGVGGTGTPGHLSQWTATDTIGDSVLFQSGTGSTARIGINTTSPLATLNVKGTSMFQGSATMASAGVASPSAGTKSYPLDLRASAYNSGTSAAVNQNFQWIAEPSSNNTTNPTATLNLLFGQGSTNPAETGLKVTSNGLITFAPGQTFPGGSGTVTSVELSAPSSDFTVTGSPVTSSGTLALNWTTPPTASNVANAIVKRDPNGVVVTTELDADHVYAATINAPYAIQGVASGAGATGVFGRSTNTGAGVYGNNTNSSGGYGVVGTTSNSSSGVYGLNSNSTAGAGVTGAGAWGFSTENNVHQGVNGGGWVKAMAVVDDIHNDRIVRCFNSTLAGSAATTVPCGFSYRKLTNPGGYAVNFGFNVSGRFPFVTDQLEGVVPGVSTSQDSGGISANEILVYLWDSMNGNLTDGYFQIIVF